MKLLSALVLSLGLSVSVWADDEAALLRNEFDTWFSSLNGIFGMGCSDFNTFLIDVQTASEGDALNDRVWVNAQFTSFIDGFNYAIFLGNISNGETPGSKHEGDSAYFDISLIKDQYLIVDAISVICRTKPDQPMMQALKAWMRENSSH